MTSPKHAKKSAHTGSDEILECIYEDPDALMDAAAAGGQSQAQMEVKVKPVPKPRSIHQLNNNNINAANSLDKTHDTDTAASSQSTRQSADKSPRPVRPPPKPPRKPYVNSSASVRGNIHYSRSILEITARPQDLSRGKKPPPLPRRPDLPPPSPLYYANRSPSVMSLTPEHGTGTAQLSRASSVSSLRPVSPALSVELRNSHSTYQAQGTNRSRGGVAPSPHQPPSLYRSSSMVQLSSQSRTPPSFSPPPSEINDYSFREFPSYIDPIPDELDGMTRMRSTYQSDPNYDPIYQLTSDDITQLLTWLKRVCRELDVVAPSLYGLDIQEEIRSVNERAMNVRTARRLYNLLMIKRRESLQNSIKEFQSICEKLEKVKKTNKNMGIAGGTTGAVGGVTAVVGIALAPMTMGISLIATAVGAGMVASAGGLGAHAARANKKTVNRTRVEKMVDDYKSEVADIELCLQFILSVMNDLRRHDIVKLQRAGAHQDALRMAKLSQAVFRDMNNSRRMSLTLPGGLTSGSLLKAFAADMDEYFTEKNNQKLKKSNKGKFASRVCILAKALQEELDYLIQMSEKLC